MEHGTIFLTKKHEPSAKNCLEKLFIIYLVTRNEHFGAFYSVNWHFWKLFGHFSLATLVRETRSGHFKPFNSVNWHFLRLSSGLFPLISSGHHGNFGPAVHGER